VNLKKITTYIEKHSRIGMALFAALAALFLSGALPSFAAGGIAIVAGLLCTFGFLASVAIYIFVVDGDQSPPNFWSMYEACGLLVVLTSLLWFGILMPINLVWGIITGILAIALVTLWLLSGAPENWNHDLRIYNRHPKRIGWIAGSALAVLLALTILMLFVNLWMLPLLLFMDALAIWSWWSTWKSVARPWLGTFKTAHPKWWRLIKSLAFLALVFWAFLLAAQAVGAFTRGALVTMTIYMIIGFLPLVIVLIVVWIGSYKGTTKRRKAWGGVILPIFLIALIFGLISLNVQAPTMYQRLTNQSFAVPGSTVTTTNGTPTNNSIPTATPTLAISPTPTPPVATVLPQYTQGADLTAYATNFLHTELTQLSEISGGKYASDLGVKIVAKGSSEQCTVTFYPHTANEVKGTATINGSLIDAPVTWCDSVNAFYVSQAALETAAASGNYALTAFFQRGVGFYVAQQDTTIDLSSEGKIWCAGGFALRATGENKPFIAAVAQAVPSEYQSWFSGGAQNGLDRCK